MTDDDVRDIEEQGGSLLARISNESVTVLKEYWGLGPVQAKSTAAAISNAVVGGMHDHTGRGPTRARTTISADMVTVTLRDSLAKAERRLADNGYAAEVLAQRRLMQHMMREDMITAVQTLTGRTVEALLNDNLPDPDIAVEIFLLERSGHNGAPRVDA